MKCLGILEVHEVHLHNRDHLSKKEFAALKFGESSYRREEKKSSFKAHKVKMAEYDDLDNDSRGTMDDEMVLMSRKFKWMPRKKGMFQHSSRRNDTRFKKKYKEERN